MSEISECSNCFEDFEEDSEHLPKILKCGDTFCMKCIKTFIEDNKKICPICESSIKENIEEMPINRYALNLKKSIHCDICFEEFNNNLGWAKIPRILKCGDTFCTECLNKARHDGKIKCSFCLKESCEEVEKLTINKYVIETCEKNKNVNIRYEYEKKGVNFKKEYRFKVGLLGDTNSGKTSLTHYFNTGKPLNAKLITSIGLEINYKYAVIEDKIIYLTLLDTAGQERFSTISAKSLSRVEALLLVFSLSKNFDEIGRKEYDNLQEEEKKKFQQEFSLQTFNSLIYWLDLFFSFNQNEKKIIYLIGNKCDNVENRLIKAEDARAFAKHFNIKYRNSRNK